MSTRDVLTRLTIPFLLISASAACSTGDAPNNQVLPVRTIETMDVSRYVGTWYEIAKYPNRFQASCASHTTATYDVQEDGTLTVTNRCQKKDGTISEAIGTAYQVDGPSSPKLKVRFAPWWLSWIPAVWGDYWIVDLDADYRLAAISDSNRKYLWVLSRTPKIDPLAYEALLRRLDSQGFDLSKLETTEQ